MVMTLRGPSLLMQKICSAICFVAVALALNYREPAIKAKVSQALLLSLPVTSSYGRKAAMSHP